jgi:hypothetical protein
MKSVNPFIASNGFPCLQMTSIALDSISVRKKKAKKEWIGGHFQDDPRKSIIKFKAAT